MRRRYPSVPHWLLPSCAECDSYRDTPYWDPEAPRFDPAGHRIDWWGSTCEVVVLERSGARRAA